MSGKRTNGEGSIYAYRNGFAAYVWVSTPQGRRQRKFVYGKTKEIVHERWLDLHQRSRRGPVVTRMPTVAGYLDLWLKDVVIPNLAPATASNYKMFTRLYVIPDFGPRKLDKLSVRDVQRWMNDLKTRCQCCSQGKDVARSKPKCCAIGKCCQQVASAWTIHQAWTVLCSALSNAVRDELVTRNVAALVRVPVPRPRKARPWDVEEARRFLESARQNDDPHYCAFVLILVLGLRRGEVLGLGWNEVDLAASEVHIAWQIQRIQGSLIRRETKTAASDGAAPAP